jgi:transcriptional regulator with XRE-family HTH domain
MQSRQLHGEAARAIREALGVSLRSVAKDIGASPGYLSRLENGERQPSPETAAALAKRLGVTLDAITYAPVREVAA